MRPDIEWKAFSFESSDPLASMLERHFHRLRLDAGQMLFDQGDHDDRLFVLDSGALEVSVLSAEGKKLALNQLRPGAVFGEIAVFDPGPRTASIAALKESRLRAVRHRTLVAEMSRSADLAEALTQLAGRRMRWMSQQVEDQVFLSPAARLAAKILYLSGEGSAIGMSQAQLADYVGVTREVVSKILSGWRRDGHVALSRGHLDLLAPDALRRIAGGED